MRIQFNQYYKVLINLEVTNKNKLLIKKLRYVLEPKAPYIVISETTNPTKLVNLIKKIQK